MENIEKQLVENGFEQIERMRYYFKKIETTYREQEATMLVVVQYINFGWRVSMELTSKGYYPQTFGTTFVTDIQEVENFCKGRYSSISVLNKE